MATLPLDAIATLLDQGAADSAVRLLRSSWEPELPPDDLVRMYCMWIRGLCETGELDNALTLAKRAAGEFPREIDILIALGNVHDLFGDLEQARAAFEVAIDVDGGGALQHYNLGAVLERLGREAEAETCYRHANEAERGGGAMFEATSALGAMLRRQGRLEEAEQVYDAYLAYDPIHVEILVEHGICLSDLERFEEAIERFNFALSVEPEHAGAQYNKAITLYRVGKHEQAQAALENIALWHERDISHSSVERVSFPDATILTDFMLARATGLVRGLVVHRERMRANLEASGGLCFSEAVLLALVASGLPRQEAYVFVQRCAHAAMAEGAAAGKGPPPGRFRALLGADPDVARHLDAATLDTCFDLEHHLRHAPTILARALGDPP